MNFQFISLTPLGKKEKHDPLKVLNQKKPQPIHIQVLNQPWGGGGGVLS